MAQRQFDLLVFDWDGTLMDSTVHITRCIQAACRDLGLPAPEDQLASGVIGLDVRDALQRAVPTLTQADYPQFVARYRYHFLMKDARTELFAGVRDMLRELRDTGYALAIATGKSRAGLDRALIDTALADLFDSSRCADETFSKPHPAMLQQLSDELGQDLARTAMIGDTAYDLQMAANAGAASIAVTYGAHAVDRFAQCQPRFVAHSVEALAAWLRAYA